MSDWSLQFARLRGWYAERERAAAERLATHRDATLRGLADLAQTAVAQTEIAELRARRVALEVEIQELESRAEGARAEAERERAAEVAGLTDEITSLLRRHSSLAMQPQLDDVAAFLARHHHFDLHHSTLSELRALLGAARPREQYLADWNSRFAKLDAELREKHAAANPPERVERRREVEERVRSLEQQLRVEHGVAAEVLAALHAFDDVALRRLLNEVIATHEADLLAEQRWSVPLSAGIRFPALHQQSGE